MWVSVHRTFMQGQNINVLMRGTWK